MSESDSSLTSTQAVNPPASKWWVLFGVGISTFMSALDTSVVNTALPVISASFGKSDAASIALIEWVVIVYLLLVSGLLLSFGRLGDLRGHRTVFLSGFLVFLVSSLLCALASSITMLIAARALQALGAAMLSSNSPAILTKSFPASQRGRALGLQATMTYLGLSVGPSLGGWLTDQFGWRSAFFINLPVGLVALVISLRVIPHDDPHTRQSRGSIGDQERFDLPGALTFLAGLIALLLGLNQAHAWGWLSTPILGLLAVAAIFLMVFLWIEKHASSPMLDLQLFTNRMFSASIVSAILNYICVYSILFLLPFYLIQGRQFSPSQAGLVLTSMPIIMALVAPISGHLSDTIGPRLPGMTGMGLLTAALLLLSRLAANTPLWQVALYLALAGLGIGIFISPNNSALMGSAPRHRQGIAAGVLATARSVGMVLGIGIAGAIFTSVLAMWPENSISGIFPAVQTAFLNLSSAALLGMIVSAVRGNGGK